MYFSHLKEAPYQNKKYYKTKKINISLGVLYIALYEVTKPQFSRFFIA